MEANFAFSAIAFVVTATFVLIFYLRIFRPGQTVNATYTLYKVRDEILYQYAIGNVAEDSLFIKFFYNSVNNTLKHREQICMRNLPYVLAAGENPELERKVDMLFDEVAQGPPELAAIINEYFKGFKRVFVANSMSVQIAVLANKVLPVVLILRLFIWVLRLVLKSFVDNRIKLSKAYEKSDELEDRALEIGEKNAAYCPT